MNPNAALAILRRARREGYGVAAFNAVNLETAEAAVRAAEAERAPVILQISQNAARYSSLSRLAAVGRALRADATVPVVLHFDHAEGTEVAVRALDAGFDSVMLEGAHLDHEAHVAALRALVDEAHGRGAAIEAELEIVRKGAREGDDVTSIDRIRAFVDATGCDLLAIDLGSEHKRTTADLDLDFGRLTEIADAVPHPLVLHGSSGVREDALARAARSGVAKVNIATALACAFTSGVRRSLADEAVSDPRVYLGAGRESMTARARAYVRLLGASGTVGTARGAS